MASILTATGEAAPIYTQDTVPSWPLGHFIVRREVRGPAGVVDHQQKYVTMFKMFGPEQQYGVYSDERPRDKSKVLLLEFPFEAYHIGTLQYWIDARDLQVGRFDRAYGNSQYS